MTEQKILEMIAKELNIKALCRNTKYMFGYSKFSLINCIYNEETTLGLAIYSRYIQRIIIPICLIESFAIKDNMTIINEGIAIKND